MATTEAVGDDASEPAAPNGVSPTDAGESSFGQLVTSSSGELAPVGSRLEATPPDTEPHRWFSRPNRGTTAAERYLQVALGQQQRNLRRATAGAITAYGLLALLAYWPINPVSTSDILFCGCFDPSQQTWSLGWTAFAVAHHFNPFFTNYVDYPLGANMATNQSMPLLALLGAPVTWLLGPTATFNLMFRVAIASSGIAMFLTLRRFVVSQAAAFVGGLLYAFSPYMLGHGAIHLSLTFVPFPPLILGALHDLLVARRRGPLGVGVKLGLLCAAQYFVDPEVLADSALLAVIGIVVLMLAQPVHSLRAGPYLLRGFGIALAVFVPICGYPIWFEVRGGGHLVSVMPFGAVLARGIDLFAPIVPTVNQLLAPAALAARGTSFGPLPEDGGYLGVTLIVVLVVTLIVLFKDPLVRFFAVMECVAFTCALGTQLQVDGRSTSVFLPINLIGLWPVISAEIAARYSLYMQLFAAILLAVALDRTTRISVPRRRVSLPLWWAWRRMAASGRALQRIGRVLPIPELARIGLPGATDRRARLGRLGTPQAAAFTGLAVFALLPLVPRLPFEEVPTGVPTALLASRLVTIIPPGSVVLAYPPNAPPGSFALMWAASDDYRFRLIGGYFATAIPNDGGDPFLPPVLEPTTMNQLLGAAATGSPAQAPPFDRATISSLRLYVRRYHVDAIIYQKSGDWQLGVRFLKRAFGPPRSADGYDVWEGLWHGNPRPA